MSSAESTTSDPPAPPTGPRTIARLDRLPRSAVAYAATGIVGLGLPTRIRSAGFGLVDGIGVLGGALGVLVIAPLVPLPALLVISGFLVVSAVLAQFTPRTRNRALEEVSP